MDDRYRQWIEDGHWDNPNLALAQCIEVCAAMRAAFPELSERNGVVWSDENRDNYGDTPKEYMHRWLVTPDGEIVDPTASQYCLLGKLEYKEFDLTLGMWRCRGCGRHQVGPDNYYCGCKWSE